MNLRRFLTALFLIIYCDLFSQPLPEKNNPKTITTDKACYNPGETVVFTVNQILPPEVRVKYKYLDEEIGDTSVTGKTWKWVPPIKDFKGYLVELYKTINGHENIITTIAVDVSSDWSRFPRYGFLSKYGKMPESQTEAVINNLNRYHINGLQFYDWQYKHHQPLAGTVSHPTLMWKDIGDRDIYLSAVKQYIKAAHAHNMKALAYNLIYGAWEDAKSDGVKDEWYMFIDSTHTTKQKFILPSPFLSDIYLLDPSNKNWQQYIIEQNKKMYTALGFDGYHVDQLGDWHKKLYSYSGSVIDLPKTFLPFLLAMKKAEPQKSLVMNSVNQYGQESIAKSPVDFLYTEVWPPNDEFKDLAAIIKENDSLSKNTKQTVLAAYMNYKMADHKGFFNTHSVLLADAVIFAFGAAHLEMGEHMLDKEYFPQDSLKMKADLQQSLIIYYDFLVAYENLLRSRGTFNNPIITSLDEKMKLNNWPPSLGTVSVIGKYLGQKQIIHLINFANASSLNWRDTDGKQPAPRKFTNMAVSFLSSKTIKKIWFASPDVDFGASQNINFTQSGNSVNFTLPSLQYWDMVVVEY